MTPALMLTAKDAVPDRTTTSPSRSRSRSCWRESERSFGALLELLIRHAGTALTRATIRERVWGYDDSYAPNTLDVYVSYLRRKTEEGGHSRLIHTSRGVGFMLRSG